MNPRIGVRHESKDLLERRSPLTPEHVRELVRAHGVAVTVQPSQTRVFADADYAAAGADLSPDLSACNLVLGVKEIPEAELQPAGRYCFFSHTTKAQPYNMPMLKRILELRNTLLDYEFVRNERGRRLIAFGAFAGYAGMLNTLWALGRRLRWEGIANPFERIRRPHRYADLAEAEAALKEAARVIKTLGLPPTLVPMVVGFTGQGRVSRGAQAMLRLLPTQRLDAAELPAFFASGRFSDKVVYRVEFHQADMYEPIDPGRQFERRHFHRRPQEYVSRIERVAPLLTALVNGIYWEPRYPRLLTRDFVRGLYASNPNPRLRVIGDITCDVEGSIEFTVKATTIDEPVFVYDPFADRAVDGLEGLGPVVMAVDKLPAELPRQASESFGDALLPFVKRLARVDFSRALVELGLPQEFDEALIAHRGELAPRYRYLEEHLS